jgi:predicted HAD superfamily phosphohydrolase YqeG
MLSSPPNIPGITEVLAALIVDLSETLAPWDHADAAFAAAGLVRVTS